MGRHSFKLEVKLLTCLLLESKTSPTTKDQSPQSSVRGSTRRGPGRRPGRNVIRAEALDDSLGPLGPLGDNFNDTLETSSSAGSKPRHETPPEPPLKEDSPRVSRAVLGVSPRATLTGDSMDTVPLSDSEADMYERTYRRPPATDFSQIVGGETAPPPKTNVEQPASPSFDISVGDPHKVGDLTSAHTVYQVRTKVSSSPLPFPCFGGPGIDSRRGGGVSLDYV